MTQSMTAFARGEVQLNSYSLNCEIRSVNQRYLDAVFRLPDPIRAAEPLLRDKLRKSIQRGKVECHIKLQHSDPQSTRSILDHHALDHLTATLEQLTSSVPELRSPDPLELLNWPGILVEEEIPADELLEGTLVLFNQTLGQLIEARHREGDALRALIEERLVGIDSVLESVRGRVPEIQALQREKITNRINEISADIDQNRLEQELVYLAQKSDIAEEIDRLSTHLVEIRRALDAQEPVGRRLDFLMQELNREANTLSSKSIAAETSSHAVELKVFIEQMREQVQNIE